MKKNYFAPVVLLGCIAASAPALFAEPEPEPRHPHQKSELYESEKLVVSHNDPALKSILSKGRHQDVSSTTPVPSFAIHTRDNRFVLSIGGQINPQFGYDLGNDLNAEDKGAGFVVSSIPVPAQRGKKSDFFINPLNGYLDFTVVGFGGTENQITGYFKLGMNGSSNQALLKRAYINWRGLTVGENQTLLQDGLAAQPTTIDTQGPGGEVGATAYQIAYKSPSFNNVSFAAALEMPTYYSSNGIYRGKDYAHEFYGRQVTGDVNQLVPDIPLWVQYQPSESNRIRVSAILRNFLYRDLLTDKTRHVLGWGTMISGNFSFYKPLVFNFQAIYGKGLGNYIQDLQGLEISFTPSNSEVGRMDANPAMGLVFGASYTPNSKWQFNAVGSYTRIWRAGDYATDGDADGIAGPNNYRYGTYLAVNALYNITSYLQWGIEYDYGQHHTYGMGQAHDSRIQTQLSLTF